MIYYGARVYWELLWLLPLYRVLGGELLAPPPQGDVIRVAKELGFKITNQANTKGVYVTCWQDGLRDKMIVKPFLKNGGKVVVLHHAWDTEGGIVMKNRYWNNFSVY